MDSLRGIYYKYVLDKRTAAYHLRYHSKLARSDRKAVKRLLKVGVEPKDKEKEPSDKETLEDANSNYIIWIEKSSEAKIDKEKLSIAKAINARLKSLKAASNDQVIDIVESDDEYESLEVDNSSDQDTVTDIEELTTKYPPCIRAILVANTPRSKRKAADESCPSNVLGSLYVIPFTGGSIGKDSKKHLIDLTNERDVATVHATITYDKKLKQYFVKGKSDVA